MANYYQPSGKFAPTAFLYFLLIAFLAGPILGFIYAYAIWYIPFIYVNFLIAGGFGFAMGWLINNVVVKQGKIRNVGISLLMGVLAGVIALYFHWTIWVDLVLKVAQEESAPSGINFAQIWGLASNPGVLFALIGEINEFGTWGFKSSTVSGGFLTFIWIVELLIIVGVATLVSAGNARKPFCELNNSWFKENKLSAFNVIENKAVFVSNLEMANESAFEGLQKMEDTNQHHSIFTLYTSDKGENYLSVENKIATMNDKGEVEFKDDAVVEYIAINGQLGKSLLTF